MFAFDLILVHLVRERGREGDALHSINELMPAPGWMDGWGALFRGGCLVFEPHLNLVILHLKATERQKSLRTRARRNEIGVAMSGMGIIK